MRQQSPLPEAPSAAAVTARSVVLAAPTLLVRTPEGDATVTLAAVDDGGDLLLLVPAGEPLAVATRSGELPACVEGSAVTPAPLPDRVLARVWLRGALTEVTGAERRLAARVLAAAAGLAEPRRVVDVAADEVVLRLVVRGGEVVDGPSWAPLCARAWGEARPDPLARHAAALVEHLRVEHPVELAALAALAVEALPRAVTAVAERPPVLVGLDARGLRWRCATPGGAVDARLEFSRPLTDPAGLGVALRDLTGAGRCCPVRDCDG